MAKTSSTKTGFLLLLAAIATLLLALIIAPFAGALFAAAVFAGVTFPMQAWLQKQLWDRPGLAAGTLTIGLLAIVGAPLVVLSVYAAEQVTDLYRTVDETLRSDGLEGVVELAPEPVRGAARYVGNLLIGERGGASAKDGAVELSSGELGTVAQVATGVLDTMVGLLIDLGVLVIAFFFLVSQGDRLVRWIVDVLPLSAKQSTKIVGEFRDVTRGVFLATIATAFLQTIVATVGYLIAGVSYLPALILLTLIGALVPVVGGALIVVAVGGWLMLSGDSSYGLFLIVWGALPVGLSDNLVKPWLAKGSLRLPGSVVLFAMMGGLAVFGAMGVVAGPLIVAFFLATLRLLRQAGVVDGSKSE